MINSCICVVKIGGLEVFEESIDVPKHYSISGSVSLIMVDIQSWAPNVDMHNPFGKQVLQELPS